MTHSGQPAGMYPVDANHPNECENLEELIRDAENISDNLNLPISWYLYDEDHEDWNKYGEDTVDDDKRFELVFLMPRKYGTTFSYQLRGEFDSAKLMDWLNQWLPGEISNWFGWDLKLEYEGEAK